MSDVDMRKLRDDIVFDASLRGHHLRLHSTWGLFSPRQIDEGTELLLEYVTPAPAARILDIGCGYGPLGLTLARLAPEGTVDLVDKDFIAVEYTNANANRNGIANAQSYLSNGFSHVPSEVKFDLIVSNLPAKVGNEMFAILFEDAWQRMNPGATIVVVTINGLRQYVKRAFTTQFGNYKKLKQGKTYTVAAAQRDS